MKNMEEKIYIGEFNLGFEYALALSQLYGIENAHFISAEGLDIEGADVDAIMNEACNKDFDNYSNSSQ